MTKKLYVGNLAPAVNSEALRSLFSPHGTITSINLITDRQTGASKGYGFVEFDSEAEAQAAIDALNGTDYNGQALKVAAANPPEKRAPKKNFGSRERRGGSFGRDDNRGGGGGGGSGGGRRFDRR